VSSWTQQEVRAITAPSEVEVVTRRADGTPRPSTTIWIVSDRERVFLRSTNGRGATWFSTALSGGEGQIVASGRTYDVRFTEAASDDLEAVDRAYRAKYGGYASIVDHPQGEGPRAATLELRPVSQ
jgi:hypothetical protein